MTLSDIIYNDIIQQHNVHHSCESSLVLKGFLPADEVMMTLPCKTCSDDDDDDDDAIKSVVCHPQFIRFSGFCFIAAVQPGNHKAMHMCLLFHLSISHISDCKAFWVN